MSRILFLCASLALAGCVQNPVAEAPADPAGCKTVESRLGSHILRRDDCVIVTDSQREAARAEVEAMRANQQRQTMPQAKDGK
jgi:hypothetical protein